MISNRELNTLAICAFRYALGRKTYVTHEISQLLIDHIEDLDDHTKTLMRREILEAIEKGMAGMNCDVECWERLMVEL